MRTLTLTFALLFSVITFAQKDFEGVIQYEISYDDMNDQMKAMESMLPSEMTVEVKDGMAKTTQPNPMGSETIVISNNETGETMTLMDMMGNKIALKTTAEDVEKQQEEVDVEIEYTDETQEIAGYECKKAIVTGEDGSEAIVYYTEELPGAKVGNVNQVKGFPMKMEISQEMFTMITTVTKVEKKKVKKIKMEVPSDYSLKTQEELQQIMQGGGGM
ncbi:MAG: DUF4412 domain-containing protein [Vicingaceae bacterium]